jgi:hypothetical protein
VLERDGSRVQHEPPRRRTTVDDVARDGRTGVRELDARLVRPPGLERQLEHRATARPGEDAYVGHGFLRAAHTRANDAHGAAIIGRESVAESGALGLRGPPLDAGDVRLVHGPALELTGERRIGFAAPRVDQDAAGVPVEALVHAKVR